MAPFCDSCGEEVAAGLSQCPACGAPLDEDFDPSYETDELLDAVVLDRDDTDLGQEDEEETAEIDAISGRAEVRREETHRRLRESGAIAHMIPEAEYREEESLGLAYMVFMALLAIALAVVVFFVLTR